MRIFGRNLRNPFQRNGTGDNSGKGRDSGDSSGYGGGGGTATLHRGKPAGGERNASGGPSDRAEWDSDDPDNYPTAPSPKPDETTLAEILRDRMRSSQQQRHPHELRYRQSLRYYLGDQAARNTVGNTGTPNVTPDASGKIPSFAVHNKLRPIARKHITRDLSARVDTSISPLTGLQSDVMAAQQGRGLSAHFSVLFEDESRLLDYITHAKIVGPVFRYTYFDPRVSVPVPTYNEQTGELASVEDAPAGELCECLLSHTEVYPDPRGTDPDEWGWVLIARRMSLREIRLRWENGWKVKEDKNEVSEEEKNQIDATTGNQNRDALARQYATVITLWEQPSDEFPDGMYCVMAGGIFLEEPIDWPYTKMRHRHIANRFNWPVAPLMHEKGIDSFWGDNCLTPLLGMQKTRNVAVNKFERHMMNGDGKILAPRGCEIAPGSFRSGEPNEVVYFTVDPAMPDRKPEYLPTEPLDPSIPGMIQLVDSDMGDIGEVNAVSKGEAPYAGAPGVVVQALQDADNSSAAISLQHLRRFMEQTVQNRLDIAQQFYTLDRMIYAQNSDTTDEGQDGPGEGANTPNTPQVPRPKMVAASFKEFSDGRFVVTATTSTPKTPAARMDLMIQLFKAGAFVPDALPATIVMLKASEATAGEKWVDDLLPVLQGFIARQDAAQAQAQQTQSNQAQTQAAMQEHAAQAKIAQSQAQETARAQADIAVQQHGHDLTMQQIIGKAVLQGSPNLQSGQELGQGSGAYPQD